MTKTRVFVVDDSAIIRRVLIMSLSSAPDLEIVGQAPNGKVGVQQILETKPNVVIMDVEMPEMTGVEAVGVLRKAGFRAPIIMFSTRTSKGTDATMEALLAGATAYVTKPNQGQNVQEAIDEVRGQLIPKIRAVLSAAK